MDSHNSAHEAPQGRFAHSPTGFRRMTPGLLKADRSAEKFTGFPKGIEAPGQLLAAFKAAAPRLGISSRLVHAVDYLFCHTQPQDWQPDSRPIVWPSNEILRTTFGISQRQVQDITRCLIELGLVTMKDSPNGKRYGKRDKGRITEAYGFDLSLFAVRHPEFVRLAREHEAERQAMRKLRRRRTIAHKGIIQILETAQEYGFDGEEWQTLARETKDLVRALKAVERPDEMQTGVASLERRWLAARERIESLLKTVETAPKDAENLTHYNNYNQIPNLNKDTVIAAKESSEAGETAVPQSPTSEQRRRPDKGMVHKIAPDELVQLSPKLKPYLRWPDIVDAADWLRGDLGVSRSLWADACVTMSRELAAIAIAIIASKEPGEVKIRAATSAA